MKQDVLKLAKLWHPQPNKFIFSIQIIIFCFISASVQLDLCLINIFCSLKELFWGCCCWTPLTTTPGPPWCPPMQSYQTAEPFFGFSQQDELNSSECEYFVLWKVPPGPLWFLIVEPPKCSQLPFSQCAVKSSCVWAFPHRPCDKIGSQFLSSPGGLHPHGPGAVPLKVAVGPLGLYSLDPDPLPSRPCSQTCLVHFEINDLVISTEFFWIFLILVSF